MRGPFKSFQVLCWWHGSALALGFHKDNLSCSSSSHARASGISHLTQSQLMTLYTKLVSAAGARQRPAMGGSGLSQQQQQWRIDTRTHRHTHKQTHVYIYMTASNGQHRSLSISTLAFHYRTHILTIVAGAHK